MSTFTDQEYIELIRKLADSQYGDTEEDTDPLSSEWIPAESDAKSKMIKARTESFIDLTTTKKDKIGELLFQCTNLKVYTFTIRITKYHGEPHDGEPTVAVDIALYHQVSKTPSGAPCRMTYPLNIQKDSRFINRPWLSYFDSATSGGNHGTNIPVDTLVDIIRWLQIVKKLPAFI